MIFKNQNFKTEVSFFPFRNLWKVRKCVGLLYIKCQDLKKKIQYKTKNMLLYRHTTCIRIAQSLKLKIKIDGHFFTILSLQPMQINASEKYYPDIYYLYLKVSHSKNYKSYLALWFPLLKRENYIPYQGDMKATWSTVSLICRKPPMSTSLSDYVRGSTMRTLSQITEPLLLRSHFCYNFGTLRYKCHLLS